MKKLISKHIARKKGYFPFHVEYYIRRNIIKTKFSSMLILNDKELNTMNKITRYRKPITILTVEEEIVMTSEEKFCSVCIIITVLAVVLNQVWKGHSLRILGL